MSLPKNLSLELSRRQKRLMDWQTLLTQDNVCGEMEEVQGKFSTYETLISKAAKAVPAQQEEAWNHLLDLDRELNSLFTRARHETRQEK